MDERKANTMHENWAERFRAIKCCVIIPTYNNDQTLQQVITDVSAYTRDILVVNDGSTDKTSSILAADTSLRVVSYMPNKGKGFALRRGFNFATQEGYEYAITIDSDGQHFAADLPLFLNKITEAPGSLIIGARNMNQSSVPGKSSMGNKISTFWFKFETGIELTDTQSGFRLYPLSRLRNMTFFTNKYEFEIEVIVRAAWKGIPVISVPVQVFYASKESRVSHFRPFRDFSRVGLLNTLLVVISIFYIKPLQLWRSLKKKNLRQRLHEELFKRTETNTRKAVSIGFGAFMGIVPVWGYQMLIAISLSYLFKLNKVLVVLAANISIPPFIPIIIYLSYITGGLVLHQQLTTVSFSSTIDLDWIRHNMYQYVVGSMVVALVTGITFGLGTWIFLKFFSKKPH